MSFGEETVADAVIGLKEMRGDSYEALANDITYIPFRKAITKKGRLGSVTKIAAPVVKQIIKSSVEYDPNTERRLEVGISADINVLLTIRSEDLPEKINKEKDRFIVFGREYRVEDWQPIAPVVGEILFYAVGLVTK